MTRRMRIAACLAALLLLPACGSGDKEGGAARGDDPMERLQELRRSTLEQHRQHRSTMGEDEARQATVAWLLRQTGVDTAGVAEDGDTVWVVTTDGIELDVLAGRPR